MLTSKEVVERLCIRPALLTEWIAQGVVPRGTKRGRNSYWTEEEFAEIKALYDKRKLWRNQVQVKRRQRNGKNFVFAHPLLEQLVTIILDHSTIRDAADRAGYDPKVIRLWYRGSDPRLVSVAEMAEAVGYELILRKKQ